MDFQKKKRKNNEDKYHFENLKIAREFSKEVILELKDLVRSIVIFGSNARNTMNKDSDIDIMVVLDNVSVYITEDLRTAYLALVKNLNIKFNNKLHILNMDLSTLWDYARKGDPLLINILRYGVPLFDRDLIEPLQYLLEIGKIKPTRETALNYISRAEHLLEYNHKYIYDAVLDLYYAIVDSVHSSLIVNKVVPPSPSDMPKIFKETFKKDKELLTYLEDIEFFYSLAKKIEHNEIPKISGKEFDNYLNRAKKLVSSLNKYSRKVLKNRDMFDL